MSNVPIHVHGGDAPALHALLDQRINEFNAAATGYHDAESFSAAHQDSHGAVLAGVYGYTWGGCAYVSHLWVAQSMRGQGIGSALLAAAESHARTRECRVIFLATHSFQGPEFYARLGYSNQGVLEDHPVGHRSILLEKRLLA
ncbi:MAG: GNAT family N-acetyltransferase [Gemmatimonadota bacterium]